MAKLQTQAQMAAKRQKFAKAKLSKTIDAVDSDVESTRDDIAARLESAEEDTDKRIEDAGAAMGTYLDRAEQTFQSKLTMTGDSIGAFLPKTAGKVESDALRQSATIDQNNVMVLEGINADLGNSQSLVDESSKNVKKLSLQVEGTKNSISALRSDVDGWGHFSQDLGSKVAGMMEQADRKKEQIMTASAAMQTESQETLGKEMSKALNVVGKTQADLRGAIDEFQNKRFKAVQNVVDDFEVFKKWAGGQLRAGNNNILEGHQTIERLTGEVGKLRERVDKSTEDADGQLSKLGVEVETEKDDLMANAKETYEKMETELRKRIASSSDTLNAQIDGFYSKATEENRGLDAEITATKEAGMKELRKVKTRISNLTAGYQQQEAELAKTEDYNEDNKKMADQLKDAFEKFKQTAEGWQSDDKKLDEETKAAADEKVAQLNADSGKMMDATLGQVRGYIAKNQHVLTEIGGKAEEDLLAKKKMLQNLMQVAEGDFQQLEKTATDSEKKWQADTRGEEALKKADAAIGQLKESGQELHQAGDSMSKKWTEARQAVTAEVGEFDADQAKAWKAVGDEASDSIDAEGKADAQRMEQLMKLLKTTGDDVTKQVENSENADHDLRNKVKAADRKAKAEDYRLEGEVYKQVSDIRGNEREELGRLEDRKLKDAQMKAEQQHSNANVEGDVEKQAMDVEYEVMDSKAKIDSMMKTLDNSAEAELHEHDIDRLKKLREHAVRVAQEKEGEVGRAAARAVGRLEELIHSAEVNAMQVGEQVGEAQISVPRVLKEAKKLLDDTRDEVDPLVEESDTLDEDIERSIAKKMDRVETDFNKTRKDLEDAVKVGEYQGEGAIDDVSQVVGGAQNETNKLLFVQKITEDHLNQWRDGIAKIFSALGLELNLTAVEAMAAANMANDNGGILSAEEEAKYKVDQIKKKMALKMQMIEDNLKAMMEKIMNDENLSEEEKARMIEALKKAAMNARNKILAETR